MGPMHRALRQQLEKPRCAVAVVSFKRHPSTSVITRTSKSLCVPILGTCAKIEGAFSAWMVRGGGRIPPSIRWWQTKASWQAVSRPIAAGGGDRRAAFTGLATRPYSGHQVEGGAPVGGLPTSASRQFCSPRGKAEVGNASNSSARNVHQKRAPAHHSSLNTKQDCLKIVDTFRTPPVTRWSTASSAIRCRFVYGITRLEVLSRVPSAVLSSRRLPSLDWVPVSPVPQRHQYYEGATTSHPRIPGHLFASLPGPTRFLLASCSLMPALPGGWRSRYGPGSLFSRRSYLPARSRVDVSGISQVSRRPILCLCPGPRPRPDRRTLAITVSSMLPLLTRKQRLQRNVYIEATAGLKHLLSTLQERCCHRHMQDSLPAG